MTELLTARQAADGIEDGQTLALIGSGGGLLEPDLMIAAIAERFRQTGRPCGLTLLHSFGMGDRHERGIDPLAEPGLLRRVISGHWGMAPRLAALAHAGEIEGYNLPLGVMGLLYREIAGGRPGLITKVGLGTFVDPRIEGGRVNARTTEDLVEVIEIGGEEYLLYRSLPIDFAVLRGTTADRAGNVSLAGEATYLDSLALAGAARASSGRVVVQVRDVLPAEERLAPADVRIPRIWVDAVVEHPQQQQTYAAAHDPVYAGLARAELTGRVPLPLGPRKVIARRAAQLLRAGTVGNVGVGVPEGVGVVLAEEGCTDDLILTVEHGTVGGVSELGFMFGAIMNFEARVEAPDIIDFYHGGSLDVSFLGFAEVDRHGNANVSRYGGILQGSGGFVDIAQSARTVVFCGTFTAGGLEASVRDGALSIGQDGRAVKLVADVEQITFSGPEALRRGHRVYVVTERAVFELREAGLTLIEIAPGVDLERDVLSRMGFRPEIAEPLGRIGDALFWDPPFGLAEQFGATGAERLRTEGTS